MSKRTKRSEAGNTDYAELALILRAWREKKYASSLALFKAHEFSFSYSTYASFESGKNLPSVSQLCELGEFLGETLQDIMLTWARVQMPTNELRTIFKSRNPHARREKQVAQPLDLDSVWVLNPGDLAHLEKFPWLVGMFRLLCGAHPGGLALEKLERRGRTPKAFERECLKPWLENGVMILEKRDGGDELRLARPDVHIPNNDQGKKIRRLVMQETFQEMVQKMENAETSKDVRFHLNMARSFTDHQAQRWQARLEQMQEEYYALPFQQPGDGNSQAENTFSFLVLFAKR